MKTYHQDGNHRKSAFSGLQKDYEAARPQYPLAALELIKQHCPLPRLICDIGCGTGKLTRQLGALFPNTEILGFDINADMVSAAKNVGGSEICYAISAAEDLPLTGDSADIITVAQAVHWFDRPTFFREALRVLSASGVLFLNAVHFLPPMRIYLKSCRQITHGTIEALMARVRPNRPDFVM